MSGDNDNVGSETGLFLFITDYLHCYYIWREFTAGLYKFSALEGTFFPLACLHCARVDRNKDFQSYC